MWGGNLCSNVSRNVWSIGEKMGVKSFNSLSTKVVVQVASLFYLEKLSCLTFKFIELGVTSRSLSVKLPPPRD